MLTLGVLALQGAVSEHADALNSALHALGKTGRVIYVKNVSHLTQCDGLAMPGGESTTMIRLITKNDLYDALREFNKPILATCSGMILVCKEATNTESGGQKLLGLVDARVNRNAFGTQRDSFEADVRVDFLPQAFPAVFIRSPVVEKTWGKCEVVSRWQNKIIGVKQKNVLALSFHPELSGDLRIHEYFIENI